MSVVMSGSASTQWLPADAELATDSDESAELLPPSSAALARGLAALVASVFAGLALLAVLAFAPVEAPRQARPSVILGAAGTTASEVRSLMSPLSLTPAGSNRDQWVCGDFGEWISCPRGYYAVGACKSGANKDCKSHCNKDSAHALNCRRSSIPLGNGGIAREYGWWGASISCPRLNVMVGACGSGKNNDCWKADRINYKLVHYHDGSTKYVRGDIRVYHGVRCDFTMGSFVNYSDCQWTGHKYGDFATCPSSRPYLIGQCGSGENDDCGKGEWMKMQCCGALKQ